ncbi:MAG: hypothetical protein ACR2QO_27355 [Acidimicrobiales bacterium]
MPIILAIGAALGGLAIWRRKKIGSDVQSVKDAARNTAQKMRSDPEKLFNELGHHVYDQATGDTEVDHDVEIKRIVGEIRDLDAEANPEPDIDTTTST